MTGMIFDIARFALTDGPGIRSVVFFKGCPLRCQWCHNPESQSRQPEIMFFPGKCLACGLCETRCSNDCHTFIASAHKFIPAHCNGCGQCANACPAQALTLSGKTRTAEEIVNVLKKDAVYYNNGGGITLSGGEPLFQPGFAAAILQLAKKQNWHTAIETCGFAKWEFIKPLLSLVDLWLYDVKCLDPAKHLAFTGADNKMILENLRKLNDSGSRIELRAPLIPKVNDGDNDIRQLVELAESLRNVTGIHPEPYHPFGQDKIKRLGRQSTSIFHSPDDADLQRYKKLLGDWYI